jgi:dTDP-4-amino-4,6-dideoxygalactose transaminase
LLKGSGVELFEEMEYGKPVYHIYPVFTRWRDALADHLKQSGVATGIHYPIPVHMQPAYADLGIKQGDMPLTERAASQELSLPMFAELTDEQVEAVATAVRAFDKKAADAIG